MYTQYAFLDKEIVIIVDISNGLNIMSYFGHIVPHSFRIVPHSYLCEVSIETPSMFTHRKLASLKKIPTGVFTMCPDCLMIMKNIAALILCLNRV